MDEDGKRKYYDIKPRSCLGCGHVFRSDGGRLCRECLRFAMARRNQAST